jgi:hypothetical protein
MRFGYLGKVHIYTHQDPTSLKGSDIGTFLMRGIYIGVLGRTNIHSNIQYISVSSSIPTGVVYQ